MKGADVVMGAIVQYNDWLEEEVCTMGSFALRNPTVKSCDFPIIVE